MWEAAKMASVPSIWSSVFSETSAASASSANVSVVDFPVMVTGP